MEFHLGDILSITTGRLVSPRHIDGVYDILNFMTGDNLFTHQLPRASRDCKPELKRQFPQLFTPEIDYAIVELDKMLETPDGIANPQNVVNEWVAQLAAKYGETLEVSPLKPGTYKAKGPLTELSEMMRPEQKIITVVTP